MLPVDDLLDAVLLGCFLFGFLLSIALLFVGDLGVGSDLPGADHGHGALPINLSAGLAFVAWFGGVAYLARHAGGWPAIVSLALGVVGGLAGALVVAWFVAKLGSSQDAVLDPADYRLPGTIARVTSSIRAEGTGEVVYEQRGVRQVSAARSADGSAIPRGAEVVVVSSRRGIALVEPAASFFAGDPILVDSPRGEGGIGAERNER